MSIFGFSVLKDLFEHGITHIIFVPVADDERIFWHGWTFGRISTFNALNQPKFTYRSGVLIPFHTHGGGISDFLHNFQLFGDNPMGMRRI